MAAILEQLFAQTETAVAVVDRAHCVLAWNNGAERMLGWPSAEALGQDVVTLLAPHESPLRRYVGAALLGDVVQAVPVMLRRKGGGVAELILGCRGTHTEPGARPTAVLFLDPTPRHQTVAATLAQRTRELQGIIGAFPDLFLWTDRQGRVLDYHAGTEADLALWPDRFLGRSLRHFLDPEAAARLGDAIDAALRDHRMVAVEYTLGKSETASSFEARIVPIAPDRVVVVVRNTTAQRAVAQQLRRAQKIEAVGRLAGGIAHDFNNLLTVVQGCATTLREELAGTPDGPVVDELLAAADKAGQLTRQLSAVGRREVAAARSVELNDLVLENLPLLARLVRADVTLSLDLAPESMWVFADPVQLEQVLYNLCANARDAMPGGGRLTIGTELRPAEGPNRGAQMVALVVRDSGTGMDAETLEHIFEPFFTTKGGQGTGLGLATSHGLVSQAGGRIDVTSTVGKGTRVTVLLPSRPADGSEKRSARVADLSGDRGTETVLVVEDEAVVRNAIVRTLRRRGYQVLEAADTSGALELYEANRDAVRLVVADMVMPGGSGAELAARLRQQRPGLPVVLMSGYDPGELVGDDDRPSAEPISGCVWLQKPLAPDHLLRVVRSTIDASDG